MSGFESGGGGAEFFLFSEVSISAQKALLVSCPVATGSCIAPRSQMPGREVDRLPLSSDEWSYASPSTYAFMAWCLVKHVVSAVFQRLEHYSILTFV